MGVKDLVEKPIFVKFDLLNFYKQTNNFKLKGFIEEGYIKGGLYIG